MYSTPEEAKEALREAGNWLTNTIEHLAEVEQIGRWCKSDGCSDNRDRRRGLSDAASDAYSARQSLDRAGALLPKQRQQLGALWDALELLQRDSQELSDSIQDTMGESFSFTLAVGKLQERAEGLLTELEAIKL